MASRFCWHCETKSHMTVVQGTGQIIEETPWNVRVMASFTCDSCRHPSIGIADTGDSYYPDVERFLDNSSDIEWLPPAAPGRDFPDVPEHIAAAASEAHSVIGIGAYRAAAAVARAVVEATAKDKGFKTGTLHAKIEALEAAHLIRPNIRDAAHEVRHLGNDMAHGDFVDAVTKTEAEEVLFLMDEVLHEVFQAPARIEARRAARIAAEDAGRA